MTVIPRFVSNLSLDNEETDISKVTRDYVAVGDTFTNLPSLIHCKTKRNRSGEDSSTLIKILERRK